MVPDLNESSSHAWRLAGRLGFEQNLLQMNQRRMMGIYMLRVVLTAARASTCP